MIPGSQNNRLEEALERGPDEVAEALESWRIAELEREKCEAILYAKFKAQNNFDLNATGIKALINASEERYAAVLTEIKAEANYERLYERLMANKKRADLRTAF